MRITNKQKIELKNILTESGLDEEQFEFVGEDEKFQIKFRTDFFTFSIEMYEPEKYLNTITYVNNKKPHSLRQNWKDTISQFQHWAKGISEDVKHLPKAITKKELKFPPEIFKYSKAFVEIYEQASTAEANGLNEICGLGYRKAFEFLIKDFLLKKHPKTEHSKIKEMQISPCINQYVTSDEIKLLAIRVLWLGNDQAHYLKKWKGKKLSDLKSLIDLTIKWILIRDELSKVEKDMPKGK
ncbi:hypothetical protein QWZ08_14345 [Ferruginibacter paludis]|uniref:hypothetical protein n=1 Tax=Ferruginibacter paludis TaxID=1310417 RepID=UPI0025B415EC|nr:hypothetical protein [Ferruginibacter paludis]MDN3656823.1 hypothetical protein [Ferruginibacter paludis]